MTNFFENHFEEIQLISSRSRQEARKSYSRLQRKTKYTLCLLNGKVKTNQISIHEGINVHQFTDDGKVTLASSDRIYLPDVATRLYQNLDNLLKSYKPHRVHSTNKAPQNQAKDTNLIEYIDLSDWNNEFYTETLTKIYENLSDNIKKNYDVNFELDGNYSVWNIYTPEEKTVEYDEFILVLNYKIFNKKSGKCILDWRVNIPSNEIRNQNIDFEKVVKAIEMVVGFDAIEEKSFDQKKTSLIILSSCFTADLFYSAINQDKNTFKKNLKVQVSNTEKFDKFGNELEDCDFVEFEQKNSSRQATFHHKSHSFPNKVSFKKSKESEIDLIESLQKKFGKKTFVLVFGSTGNLSFDKHHDEVYFTPLIAIHFDGKKFHKVNLEYLHIPDASKVKFSESTIVITHRSPELDLYFHSELPDYSYLELKEAILV